MEHDSFQEAGKNLKMIQVILLQLEREREREREREFIEDDIMHIQIHSDNTTSCTQKFILMILFGFQCIPMNFFAFYPSC